MLTSNLSTTRHWDAKQDTLKAFALRDRFNFSNSKLQSVGLTVCLFFFTSAVVESGFKVCLFLLSWFTGKFYLYCFSVN